MSNPKGAIVAHSTPAQLAAEWLLNSGIQNHRSDKRFRGGMHAWFDLDSRNFSFLYSEITGYAVNIFLFLYNVFRKEKYLVRAKEAAQWLIEVACQSNVAAHTRISNNANERTYFSSWIFTFDNWIVTYGLCNLYEVTGEAIYLKKAEEIADFLISSVRKADGMFYPAFNIKTKQPEATNDKWSRQSGSFHAKALFALLKLHQITKENLFYKTAEQLAQAVMALQKPDGRFVTHDGTQSTLLHPHLYTLEGLACFGFMQNDLKFIESVQKGIEWVLKFQNKDGSIYCLFEKNQFLPHVRVDIIAQTLRIGSVLLLNKKSTGSNHSLDRLKECLISYQVQSGPQQGGFLYGQEENGVSHNHLNSWVTMFAAQALLLYDFYLNENLPYDFNYFV